MSHSRNLVFKEIKKEKKPRISEKVLLDAEAK